MRLLEVILLANHASFPARTPKRHCCLVWMAFLLLQDVDSWQSISASCRRGRYARISQRIGVHRRIKDGTSFAFSLRKELDCEASNVVSQSNIDFTRHAVSEGLPSSLTYECDTLSENTADVPFSPIPDPPVTSVVSKLPRHIAFVCDGNTRWASARNLPASMGHAAGANRTYEIIRFLQSYASSENPRDIITHATFYAFSTENWNRPPSEIREIFTVIERTARQWYSSLSKDDDDAAATEKSHIIFKTIGDLYDVRIPKSLRDSLLRLEERTQEIATRATTKYWDDRHQRTSEVQSPPSFLTICVAINYGGRQDIVTASKRLIRKMLSEKIIVSSPDCDVSAVTEDDLDVIVNDESLAACLDTATLPDPDLLVRTSGESRLSNFLLWNIAYTELYFTDTLWPDFDGAAIENALRWYSQRERRFGKH